VSRVCCRFGSGARPDFTVGVRAKNMKKLEAVIRHYKLEDVKTKLTSIGVQGMTVSEVRGFGRQRGHKETYRGAEYTVDFMPKVKMEVVVNDNEVETAIAAICDAARTGQIGDGKIFISSLEGVVRIRTGETGVDAI
jgi:nitrogen regulatory protein P-II 1